MYSSMPRHTVNLPPGAPLFLEADADSLMQRFRYVLSGATDVDACMQQWHSQAFPSEGELPCEARMHSLFGAWSLGLGQIFTDSRRLIRRLTVSGPAQLSYCSVRLRFSFTR